MASHGLSVRDLIRLTTRKRTEILEAIDTIEENFFSQEHGIELKNVAGRYVFFTKAIYSENVSKLRRKSVTDLTRSQMEVLAIIARNQSITMKGISEFRGTVPSGQVKELLSMRMIRRRRDKDKKGHPFMYFTTDEFLKALGISDISSLPKGELVFENTEIPSNVRRSAEKES